MEDFLLDFLDFVKKPAIIDTFVDILLCAVPIWVAVMIGLVIGWSWRPRWTGLVFLGLRPKLRFVWTLPPGFGARRLWLAFTALSAFSVASRLWSNFRVRKRKGSAASLVADSAQASTDSVEIVEGTGGGIRLRSETSKKDHNLVTENDLEHLLHLLDGKVGETAWQNLMERSTSNTAYQAWRHEPETGPVIYRSKTVFEDATPEMVRDFFWDDEFRPKWDPMLAYFKMVDECPHTGETIVHWIKKFPFFCSDREYIIGRRIWEAGKNYYCVTKVGFLSKSIASYLNSFWRDESIGFTGGGSMTVPHPALPRRDKPRRVEMYFSSWVIKPVQSRKGDGQLTACEVSLVHYEDMGIPKDVAKLGVRHGMWGTVKKLHGGFRAYQVARKSEAPVSRSALAARITTKISFEGTADSSERVTGEEERRDALDVQRHGDQGGTDLKWLVIGGTVALACGFHTGVIGKALLFGAGQRIGCGRRVGR